MTSNSVAIEQLNINHNQPADPCGFYLLVELVDVEDTSAGGIFLGDQKREQSAEELGYIRAVGPTAYAGWEGCKWESPDEFKKPHQLWGVDIGDLVEFRKFEGKKSALPGFENWRYIPDSHIVGVVNHE